MSESGSPVGRKPKSLTELVRAGTFRLDRHKELLLAEDLGKTTPDELDVDERGWAAIIRAQSAYREHPGRYFAGCFADSVRFARARGSR
jgi:hypothetical protein